MKNKEFNPWLLPDGIEEILPPEAAAMESISRELIDLFNSWGYQLVIPPMIEFLDSLLTGTGEDLDLQTFKITDQLTGRLMGIRADTTPQVARIDAHNLKREEPTRLCYLGTVLHTRSGSAGSTRSPNQIGAELYGHAGIESDVEVVCLLNETLNLIGIENIHLDVGHVGIFAELARLSELSESDESRLFDILQRKDKPELDEMLKTLGLQDALSSAWSLLVDAFGDEDVLSSAEKQLAPLSERIRNSIADMQELSKQVRARCANAEIRFDLADLRGYHYHSGIVFTAYAEGHGEGIAFGGRYDNVGEAFGRARAATGFSADIKSLLSLIPKPEFPAKGILCPWSDDTDLQSLVRSLRANNEIVIQLLPNQNGEETAMYCDRMIKQNNGKWAVEKL